MTGNSKRWMFGLGAIVVIAVAGVTVFLVSQPPAAQQQATGAIGAAERYRAEQIQEGDAGVTAPGAETMPATEAELAEVLGRSAEEVRVAAVRSLTADATPKFLGTMAMDLQAQIFREAGRGLHAELIAHLDARGAADLVSRLNDLEANRFLADWGAGRLHNADQRQIADYAMGAEVKNLLALWPEFALGKTQMSVDQRIAYLERNDAAIADRLVRAATDRDVAAMVVRLDDTQGQKFLAAASAKVLAEAVARADSGTRQILVTHVAHAERRYLEKQVIEARVATARMGNLPVDLQLKLFDAADLTTKTHIMARMSPTAFKQVMDRLDQSAQARFFKEMNAQQIERLLVAADRGFVAEVIVRMPDAAIRAFDRQDATARGTYFTEMKLSPDAWGRMNERARIAAIRNLEPAKQAALVREFTAAEKWMALDGAKHAERMNLAARNPEACVGAFWTLDARTREAFIAAASQQERLDAINRSDLTRGELTRFATPEELNRIRDLERVNRAQ